MNDNDNFNPLTYQSDHPGKIAIISTMIFLFISLVTILWFFVFYLPNLKKPIYNDYCSYSGEWLNPVEKCFTPPLPE